MKTPIKALCLSLILSTPLTTAASENILCVQWRNDWDQLSRGKFNDEEVSPSDALALLSRHPGMPALPEIKRNDGESAAQTFARVMNQGTCALLARFSAEHSLTQAKLSLEQKQSVMRMLEAQVIASAQNGGSLLLLLTDLKLFREMIASKNLTLQTAQAQKLASLELLLERLKALASEYKEIPSGTSEQIEVGSQLQLAQYHLLRAEVMKAYLTLQEWVSSL